MVSFAHPSQIALAADVCQSFAIDNGAFTYWKQGKEDYPWDEFVAWADLWRSHPGLDFILIPDVIDGTEKQNDHFLTRWPHRVDISCPVWHMHESMARLSNLIRNYPRVAIGSSGDYAELQTEKWWDRIAEAMGSACDPTGQPRTRLHGLRMMSPTIFSHVPFSSVDSTNVGQNVNIDKKWKGTYQPLSKQSRAIVLADRCERHASAVRWNAQTRSTQQNFELVG